MGEKDEFPTDVQINKPVHFYFSLGLNHSTCEWGISFVGIGVEQMSKVRVFQDKYVKNKKLVSVFKLRTTFVTPIYAEPEREIATGP